MMGGMTLMYFMAGRLQGVYSADDDGLTVLGAAAAHCLHVRASKLFIDQLECADYFQQLLER